MCVLSSHAKSGETARRLDFKSVDVIYAGARRAAPHGHLETLHGVGVPFGDHLDAAVVLVPYIPVNAFALCRVLDEEPEPDALYAALHNVPAPDEHGKLYKGV